MSENPPTESDRLFERYLTAHGYTGWIRDRALEGRPSKPDFRLPFEGTDLFFEVKEFDVPAPMEFGAIQPYTPLREKINQAVRQFKHYKEFSCSVVLSNPKDAFVMLEDWIILGAMFGNVGFTVQLGIPPGPENPPVNVFTTGGKMVNDKRQTPQNTTISSVVVNPITRSVISASPSRFVSEKQSFGDASPAKNK